MNSKGTDNNRRIKTKELVIF